MFSFKSLALLALAALPAARAATFEVVVGGTNGLKYNPESVTAAPGDLVRFIFQQKNHTVTQSTFAQPCVKADGGFDSGFVPVAEAQTEFPVAEFSVTSTDPVWIYCAQGTHCSAGGMVFAINPGERFAAYKAAATGAAPTGTSTTAGTATSTTASGTSSAPSSTATKDIKVIVGGPGALTFSPSNVQANIGDNIVFEFHQKNHAVIASTFDAPCVPLAASGFDSGYFPVADDATTFPTYTVRVNETKPIWAYCPQGNHCGQGMVFSVNAVETGDKTFQAFQDLAKQINGTSTTSTGGYGNGGFQPMISSASAVIAGLFALAALL
jgi:plastocyanin